MKQVLRLIQSCETLEEYKRLVSQGGHILNVLPGGVLRPWMSNGLVGIPDVGARNASAAHLPQGSPLPGTYPGSQAVGNSSGAGVLSMSKDDAAPHLDHTD